MRWRLNWVRGGVLTICLLAVVASGLMPTAMAADKQEIAAAGVLKKAIQQHRGMSPQDVEALQQAISRASELLPDDHYAQEMLQHVLTEAPLCKQPAECHRTMLSRVHESLTFRPTMEAETPQGVPEAHAGA